MMESVKMDKEFTKATLNYIVANDSLPETFVMTIGHIRGFQPVDDFYLMKMKCFYVDDLARSANILQRYMQLLIAKSNRKASDTAQTLDFLITEANDLLFRSPEGMAGYKAFSKEIDNCVKITSYLCQYAEQIPGITIKDAAKLDGTICELNRMACKIMRRDFEASADEMLKEFPEYKTKIKQERLIELIANMPVILAVQMKTGMLPSDVKPIQDKPA